MAQPVKNLCSTGDLDLIPGSERSPGEGKGYPFHGEFHGQRSLEGYIQSMGSQGSDTTEPLTPSPSLRVKASRMDGALQDVHMGWNGSMR